MITTDNFTQELAKYLSKHPPDFGPDSIHSVLDALYAYYSEHEQHENEAIQSGFTDLYICLDQLKLPDKDRVIDITCALCSEHARIAFGAGTQIGIRLLLETYCDINVTRGNLKVQRNT